MILNFESVGRLFRLFRRHFADPIAAIQRLESHLSDLRLPFHLKRQLRELPHPPQPNLPRGIPSLIYYFVPGTQRGSHQPSPEDPLDPAFLNTTDGIGLNLGCPVRLARALDVLAGIAPSEQTNPRQDLVNSRQHLSAVEELLWLRGWKSPSHLRRGGQFRGMAGDVDWALEVNGHPIFLEAKFRISDWPRLPERGSYIRIGDGFLANAAHKFPEPPQGHGLHIVGITTFDNITNEIAHMVEGELNRTRQIHAVIFRSLAQMTHIFSLSQEICQKVFDLLAPPVIKDFPLNYAVFFNRKQRDERIARRPAHPCVAGDLRVPCLSLAPQGSLPFPFLEAAQYRYNISSRGPDGEPKFEVIPKYACPPPIESGGNEPL